MNQIYMLNIEMPNGENIDYIHPVLLSDDNHYVLVDCGYVGSLPKIEEAFLDKGLSPKAVTHIILTHHDHDHVGAAAAYKQKYPDVCVMASSEEVPYISGERKSLRLEQAEQLQKDLPAEMQEFGLAFCRILRSVEPVQIDQTLFDNEILPFCGGCQVLSTPGHTPGHISLYLPAFSTIITGDAIALENGKPVLANPQFTLDIDQANASMQRLLGYQNCRMICYHGGTLEMEGK